MYKHAVKKPDRRDLILHARTRLELARRKLDARWPRVMPYVRAAQQAPTRGVHSYAHMHVESATARPVGTGQDPTVLLEGEVACNLS